MSKKKRNFKIYIYFHPTQEQVESRTTTLENVEAFRGNKADLKVRCGELVESGKDVKVFEDLGKGIMKFVF